MTTTTGIPRIIDARHPFCTNFSDEWEKWRLNYEAGERFLDRYLVQLTTRETRADFRARKALAPIPAFGKAAINDIRNSIFQRMGEIVRRDGSDAYQKAIAGLNGGVDNRGSTMNSFLGQKVLTDLLVMGRCGIFVDMPVVNGYTLSDTKGKHPYLYQYKIEDILSWCCNNPEEPSEFQSILLRDTCWNYDQRTLLPISEVQRFRMLWIDPATGYVNLQFYNAEGQSIDRDGTETTEPVQLELTRIPFVMLDITDSLIKDVCRQQIALMNLGSSDVSYAHKANFPFYTEQKDARDVGGHLKKTANEDGTATTGGQAASDEAVKVGVTQGRYYDLGAERPGFIHPSSEPLKASLELQAKLEADIRKLVNLAVINLASRASAESKTMDNQGLEAGLSFIGLVLESGERKIADMWASYEERVVARRTVATIKYPDRYSLKADIDRIAEAEKLTQLMFSLPSRSIKKEIGKVVATTLLSGKVSVDTLSIIHKEIDAAKFATSDPEIINNAVINGLCGPETGSDALGFDGKAEVKAAQEAHVERATAIAEAQAKASGPPAAGAAPNAAARGVPDLSASPTAGKDEKAASRNTDLNQSTKSPVRGKGK